MTKTSPLDTAVQALATYRIAKLIIDDKITEDIREKIFVKYGDPAVSKVSYAFTCFWCVSIYAGLGIALGDTVFPRTTRLLTRALAFSAVTGLLAENEDVFKPEAGF